MRKASKETGDPLVKRLQDVARNSPELRVTARLYEAILPLSRNAEFESAAVSLDPVEIQRSFESGTSLLSAKELEIDLQALENLLLKMLHSVEEIGDFKKPLGRWWRRGTAAKPWTTVELADLAALQSSAGLIRKSMEDGRLDIGELLTFSASGDRAGFDCTIAHLLLDAKFLWTLSQHVLRPLLHDWRRQVAPHVAGLSWQRGYCFVCGAQATLAELQENDQVKHLRCGQCGADWHYPRLQCLQCGNEDHATQKSLYVDGRDHQRIEACDECNCYLKVITAFTPTLPELVAVEDLATLDLDFIARQNGYTKPEQS